MLQASCARFRQDRLQFSAGVYRENRGEGGFIERAGLGKGLGFGHDSDRTAMAHAVFRPDLPARG
jgi:hypothetical protein